ncbi:MAG TPA: cytochrome C oxidase subunit IV family protein [Candidatus Udaeobacter sp.]|nr:cytochrome C oxidase subunit IV family protein [Candidatus Udaeobacter sp.]
MSVHVVPVRIYVLVFLTLLALTATTVYVAFIDLGPLNNVVALAIALLKTLLVILFFMGVRYSTRLTALAVAAGFFWLLILISITMADYVSRGWMGVPGK